MKAFPSTSFLLEDYVNRYFHTSLRGLYEQSNSSRTSSPAHQYTGSEGHPQYLQGILRNIGKYCSCQVM